MSWEEMTPVWQVRERLRDEARTLAKELDLHPVAAEVLLQRGIRGETALRRFLYPDLSHLHDPLLLEGMEAAVARIRQALARHEQITVYGDYDADGLTSTALLVRYFREAGAAVDYYIPSRLDLGYGVHQEALEMLAARGSRLIITVDCGINAREEVAYAATLGLDMIVTDHHTPDGLPMPAAVAVINPQLGGYPFAALAGVGVALKLVQALGGLAVAAAYLDLAALGTVADVVPLLDENRVITRFGLENLRAAPRLGLKALLEVAGITDSSLDSGRIAFILAPRLNAAGRLADPESALELLLTEDPDEAKALAERLNALNSARQDTEQQVFEEALAMLEELKPHERSFIVLAGDDWHPGVVGIVASRIAEQCYRPALLLSVKDGVARGSGRSIPPYNLIAALKEHEALLDAYGGHPRAAGITVSLENLPALRESLNAHVAATLTPAELVPTLSFDAELDPSEITLDLVSSLERLGPYGAEHPEPVFCSKRWRLEQANHIGKGGRHLKMELSGGGFPWEVLAWRRGEELEAVRSQEWLDVAYTPQRNVWQGRETVVLTLESWRPPAAEESIPIYDARFFRQRENYFSGLMSQESAVLLRFTPSATPSLLSRQELPEGTLPSFFIPSYFRRHHEGWHKVKQAELLDGRYDLLWADPPHGLLGLEELAAAWGEALYHQRIHLLYNRNDVATVRQFLGKNGPNRSLFALIYRFLRDGKERDLTWNGFKRALEAADFLGSREQVSFCLTVFEELGLIAYTPGEAGPAIALLPAPQDRLELGTSATFRQAEERLTALTEAEDWLTGPDAAGIITRELRRLLKGPILA